MIISFSRNALGLYLRYYIDKINEDEIGLKGVMESNDQEIRKLLIK